MGVSRRQSGDKNSSANCQNVLQNSNSQIGHIVAEPLPHVITGKGPRNRSYSAQNCSLDKRPFDHAVNCRPADRTGYNAGHKRPCLQSAGCKR